MPRAHFNKAVIRRVSGAPTDGTVAVTKASGAALTQTIYAADTGATALTSPFAFTNGVIDFFLDVPERVKLVITPNGASAQTFDAVDVPAPAAGAVSVPHTWAIPGDILAASGSDNVIPGMKVRLRAGQSATLVAVDHKLDAGTNCVVGLYRNGTLVGATFTATTTDQTYDITDTPLANGDRLTIVVTSPTGGAKTLSVTAHIEYTAA